MKRGGAVAELPIDVEEFLSWLLSERGRAANTLAAYRRDLTGYVNWLVERGLTLESVSAEDLFELIAERRAQGSAPSTIARQLAAIRSLHRFLVNEDRRADDPTADVEGVRIPAGIPKALSEAQVTALLDDVTGDDRDRPPRPRPARTALRHGSTDL